MFVPYVPQERPEHYERRQVGVGLDCQTHLSAGRPIKHPRWNLQPTVRVGCSQVAAKDNTAPPLNCLMNADPQAGPWMPRIQQLPKLGIVGVLKPCCTTRSGRTPHSDISRQHRRCSCPPSPQRRRGLPILGGTVMVFEPSAYCRRQSARTGPRRGEHDDAGGDFSAADGSHLSGV